MFDGLDILGGLACFWDTICGKSETNKNPTYIQQSLMPTKFMYRPQTFDEYISQDKAKDKTKLTIELINKGFPRHFLLMGNAGFGKCHAKGTKILMFNGKYKKVENIIKFDKIMGVDSKPRIVKGVGVGFGDMYEIIPQKGKSFIVNGEHILSLKKTGTNDILNISVLEYLKRFPKGSIDRTDYKLYRKAINFKHRKLPIDPYYLGLWLGDGSSSCNRITNIDKTIWNFVRTYAKRLNLTFIHKKPRNRADYVSIISGRNNKNFNIQAELRKLNLLDNKHIPDIYKFNSKKNRLELLAGLIDSDGYLAGGCCIEIIAKSNLLAEDIKYLAQSLGFFSYYVDKFIKLPRWILFRKYNRISIIGDCKRIPTKLIRKIADERKINKNCLYTGFKIKKLNKDFYYGFELDGNHLYMIEDFIVNHNTTLAGIIANTLGFNFNVYVGSNFNIDTLHDFLVKQQSTTRPNVLFIDEIAELKKDVLTYMLPIIEDFKLNGMELRKFILIGATTDTYVISKRCQPFLDRIQCKIYLEDYNAGDIKKLLIQYNDQIHRANVSLEDYDTISRNVRYTPRLAISLFDYFIICGDLNKVLRMNRIIKDGLDDIDVKILENLNSTNGKAIGEEALAIVANMTKAEYKELREPYLMRQGLISRGSRGRLILDKGKLFLQDIK